MAEKWYGVRCIFDHGPSETISGSRTYEERIVIVRGESFAGAIGKAERDAEEYVRVLEDVRYLGLAQAYRIAEALADDSAQDGAEVFSLMRSSALPAEEYVARFFATGTEHQGDGADDPT